MQDNILETLDRRDLGQALANARKKRGYTQADAADILGVSRTTITAIEKGDRRIQPNEFITLVHAYGRQVSEFIRPRPVVEPFQVQFSGPSLRRVEDPDIILPFIDLLEDLCRDYLALEEMTQSLVEPAYPPEYQVRGRNIEQEAEILADQERRRLGLGDRPIPNLRDILEQEVGIRIFFFKMEPSSYSAMYIFDHLLGACMGVNSLHPPDRQRFSMAHDYAHFLAHRHKPAVFIEDAYDRVPEDEYFADMFARYFLMPTSSILRQFHRMIRQDETLTPAGLCTLAAYYGVSVAAITLRLEELGKLRHGTWDYLKDQGFKVREAQAQLGIEPPKGRTDLLPVRYQYLAVYAFDEGLISEAQLARYLYVDRVQARHIVETLRRHTSGVTDLNAIDLDLAHDLESAEG